ncbi:hypothetical protein N8J89_09810 [Crossiella sp. CA-258035]|uniref:hypothetical protein n=1 Tax=Crossiella sp. CA-258035 TaxID=2981138 RepID=UPI0024BCC1A6|nr:hypothetical protein [Crossiella sp. CA-258035]WHT21329.1 hypothetical protein N8J89_09810 [Crossiella sp. CA-258035]
MRPDRYTPMGQAGLLVGAATIAVALALYLGDPSRLPGAAATALAGLGAVALGLTFLRRSDHQRQAQLHEARATIEAITDDNLRDALHASLALNLAGVRISLAELTKLATPEQAGTGKGTITVIGPHTQARKR